MTWVWCKCHSTARYRGVKVRTASRISPCRHSLGHCSTYGKSAGIRWKRLDGPFQTPSQWLIITTLRSQDLSPVSQTQKGVRLQVTDARGIEMASSVARASRNEADRGQATQTLVEKLGMLVTCGRSGANGPPRSLSVLPVCPCVGQSVSLCVCLSVCHLTPL